MGLQTKFIFCVALILVAVMTSGGFWFYRHQEAEFFDRVGRDMDLTQAFIESTRSYVRDVLRPKVQEAAPERFVPEAQSGTMVARGVFDRFVERHPNFRFKEASDNPLNLNNRADAFEMAMLRRLREDRSIKQLTAFTGEASGDGSKGDGPEWFVSAKPIVADAGCLKCHGSPADAPPEIVARYGTEHGFGWKAGDVVAALTVRVPTGNIRAAQAEMARQVATWFGLLTTATLLVVFLAAQVFVRIPVRRMARQMAEVAERGHYDRPLPEAARRDELGTAAKAFNRVLQVVARTLADLRAANETLERRVEGRTADVRRSHRHMELLREASLDSIISMDADGRITEFNPAAEKTFGYARKEVVGKSLAELLIPSHLRDAHRHGLAKYLATGKGPILGKRMELSGLRADGRQVPVELSVTAVHPDGAAAPVFTAYIRDISDRKRNEQTLEQALGALREGEERYRVLAEALPQFVWTVSADGKLEYVNRHWLTYTGLTAEQTTGGGWASVLHPDDLQRTRARWEQAKATGTGYELEKRLRRISDGSYRWHYSRVSPVRSADGKTILKWVGVATDIDDRRRTEDNVRRSEQRFRLVAQCATDVIYEWDVRSGKVEWFGDIDGLLGYGRGQFPRTMKAWEQAIHPEDRARVAAAQDRHLKYREPFNLHYRVRRADGTYLHWLDQGTAVWDDAAPGAPAAGNAAGAGARPAPASAFASASAASPLTFVGAIADVTARKAAEDARARLAAIVESSNEPIYAQGLDGAISSWNAGAERIFGYRAAEVLGKPVSILMPPECATETERVMERVRSGESVEHFETVRLAKDGRRVEVSLSVSPIRDAQGRIVGAAKLARDITDRKRAESEQRRAEGLERERSSLKDAVNAMEQVLGVVGHELRTPLAGLRAMSEYLLTDAAKQTDEFGQFITSIHNEVVRMSDTVNDLLEAARLNSGRVRWNWSTVPLEEVCRDALEAVRPLVDESRVRLELDVSPPHARMTGDAEAVRRLVLNLLNNARKHTEEGEIRVSVERFERGGRGFVRVTVRDTGTGIPPEIAARIGEPFMLNAGVVGDNYIGGTGLGLAICKGVAAAHGGTMYVESARGQGTAITAEMRTDLRRPADHGGQIILAVGDATAPAATAVAGEGASAGAGVATAGEAAA